MTEKNSRSKELLNKVYDHLDTIDVSKLSMNEMKDFLEVVQNGQFLESYRQISSQGFCGFSPFNSQHTGNGGNGTDAEK